MANLGNMKNEPNEQSTRKEEISSSIQPSLTQTPLLFQYTGGSKLTIKGLLSGKNYDFATPGAVLEVDPRDRTILSAMPKIRQI